MKNQITSRDYELISAYLDNQLGSQERVRLEARMKANPELQNEMHEISKTRLLIRSLPKIRAPRNYYINAQTGVKPARARQSLQLAPTFGIISA
jgi:anti-sigma factor RsiW